MWESDYLDRAFEEKAHGQAPHLSNRVQAPVGAGVSGGREPLWAEQAASTIPIAARRRRKSKRGAVHDGAGGGTRTPMSLRTVDFESTASTVPPHPPEARAVCQGGGPGIPTMVGRRWQCGRCRPAHRFDPRSPHWDRPGDLNPAFPGHSRACSPLTPDRHALNGMAIPAGVEPAAFGSASRCSDPLSYGTGWWRFRRDSNPCSRLDKPVS
jgi:hypothetical protein